MRSHMHDIIFVNRERDWAEMRGTDISIKFCHMIDGSRSDGFWWFRSKKRADDVYICEAAINAISLYQLRKDNRTDKVAYYVNIGGVSKQAAIERIKTSGLHVILAVDNDEHGQACRDRNLGLDYILPIHKDYNDDLMAGVKLRNLLPA